MEHKSPTRNILLLVDLDKNRDRNNELINKEVSKIIKFKKWKQYKRFTHCWYEEIKI